jgi:hypothetical protein
VNDRTYPGLEADKRGGLTDAGRVIMDAQVFGLLPEAETGAGWPMARLQSLAEQVNKAWTPYGGLPSRLPEDFRRRHERIYGAAVERARAIGWEDEIDDDE